MRSDDGEDLILWILRRCVDAMPGYAASKSNTILVIEQRARRTLGGTRVHQQTPHRPRRTRRKRRSQARVGVGLPAPSCEFAYTEGVSAEVEYLLPPDNILRELGRIQVLHSHLDHTLRLAIKRIRGIAIDDLEYWAATDYMSAGLRNRVLELVSETYKDDAETANTVRAILARHEEVTLFRNKVLHSVWMTWPGGQEVLHDRDKQLEQHVNYLPPTLNDLVSLGDQIKQVQATLDHITEKLLST